MSVGRHPGLVDADALFAAALGELETEPALAVARLADDTDHARLALGGARQFGLEGVELRLAADQQAEMRLAAEDHARRGMPDAQQPENLDRLRQTANRPSTERGGLDELAGHRRRIAGQEDFARVGHLLHAGSEVRRRTRDVIGLVQAVLDRLDDDLAGVNADPDFQIGIAEPGDGCLHGERGRAGTHCVVFVRPGRSKECHDSVASDLVDHTVIAFDGALHGINDGPHPAHRILGVGAVDETR